MNNQRRKLPIAPIPRTNVLQSVVEQLAGLIGRSGLEPGGRLPSERELAERLKVSRASVRQALKVLKRQGQVETRAGKGTYRTGGKTVATLLPASNPVSE